jgi:hypothetical protein
MSSQDDKLRHHLISSNQLPIATEVDWPDWPAWPVVVDRKIHLIRTIGLTHSDIKPLLSSDRKKIPGAAIHSGPQRSTKSACLIFYSLHHPSIAIIAAWWDRRLVAGCRKRPIYDPPAVHPPPTIGPQQPFLRLSKLLHFSPRTNTLRPGRNDKTHVPSNVGRDSCTSVFRQLTP